MFCYSNITQYHNDLLNGRTTSVEAVSFYINQIKAGADLNAWLDVWEAEALAQAANLDHHVAATGRLSGKLHGVVVGLKDVIAYKEHPLSASSKILGNYTAVYNATATERLLSEGAIIIGRQNCDEFAMGSSNENSAYGPVKNAVAPNRVPGGSSGGSAVAVQAEMCMLSLGSDTGGSVRQPADFCGVVGFKPSYGRISRYGLIAYASSFDQIGIFATNVHDVALALQVIAGADAFDSTVSQAPVEDYMPVENADKKFRIAYFNNALEHPGLDVEIATATHNFLQQLTGAGHTVEAVQFDYLDYIVPTYYVLTTAEASSNLSRYDGVKFGFAEKEVDDLTSFYKLNRSNGFGDEVKRRILLGTFVLSSGYYDAYFTKAQQVRRLLVQTTAKIFETYDAIVLPTVPTPAFELGEKKKDPIEMFLADIYTVYANLVGVPAISIPLFQHSSGLPFGLQIITPQFSETLLLQLSHDLLLMKK